MWRHLILPLPYCRPWRGGALFIRALERLQTLYSGAYARGTISTLEGAELVDLDVKLSTRTHPGAAVLYSSMEGGDPSPTKSPSLVGVPMDLLPVTQKNWLDRGRAYGGQETLDISALAGADTEMEAVGGVREAFRGIGATENPSPPPDP